MGTSFLELLSDRLFYNPRGMVPSEEFAKLLLEESLLESHKFFQTSGTSGKAKWVALSDKALEASALAANQHLGVTSSDVFALALPEFHVGGFGVKERARVSGAAFIKSNDKWNAERFTKWLSLNKVSISSLVPAQIYDLVHFKRKAPSSLRALVVGGGALPEALYFAARSLGWPLLPSYGLTECASQVATAELASLSCLEFPRAKILSHMNLEQVSEQKVSVKSPALFSFYVSEVENKIHLESSVNKGAFILPDKGELRFPYLYVSGRWQEDFKVLGEWIRWDFLKKKFLELSYKHEKFLKVELVLVPDDRRGNILALACEEFDQAARLLVEEFNADVFPFERLTHVLQGNLPRSELGKILALKINPLCLQEIAG